MMKMIRENFPNSFIWVDMGPFKTILAKNGGYGYVDQIGNDYSWAVL